MAFWIALLAAIGCAFCNGGAVVLQKLGADKHARITTFRTNIFLKLMRDWQYLAGTALDLVAWGLTLVAVQTLPLFVVQPITSFSVVVAVLIERLKFRHRLPRRTMVAMVVIITGLSMLALSASPESAQRPSQAVTTAILVAPLVLALIGAAFVRIQRGYATMALAAISGLCFGGTAVVGRMLNLDHLDVSILVHPLFISLLTYGGVGITLFVSALQRQQASVVNAVLITFETLGPAIIGLLFLGDRAKAGWGEIAVLGAIITLVGAAMVAWHPRRRPAANIPATVTPAAKA